MNFLLSLEQKMLQDAVERAARDVCPLQELHRHVDHAELTLRKRAWETLAAMEVAGLCVDEAHGGSGSDLVDAALVTEVLGYNAVPSAFLGHTLAVLAIQASQDEGLKQTWLPGLAKGELVGTVALREPDKGWYPDDWSMRPEAGRLSGAKSFVLDAGEADCIIVGMADGQLGLVEGRTGGVQCTPLDGVDRTRALFDVVFAGAQVHPVPAAKDAATRLVDAASVLIAADAFGGGRRAVDMAVEYANQREQFGVKIGQFQALKHQLANMATRMEMSRGLYWYAAYAFDHRPLERGHAASLAKAHVTEQFLQVARDAVEAHGGIGFTWDYHIHVWLKRAMFDWAWNGDPKFHRERYARLSDWQ